MTAPKEVTLTRKGQEVVAETRQMQKRIRYFTLTHQIPEHLRQEVLRVCPHCTAKLYLEGKSPAEADLAAPRALRPSPLPASSSSSEPTPKRQRTAKDCLKELREAKELLDEGVLTKAEFDKLKADLLADR